MKRNVKNLSLMVVLFFGVYACGTTEEKNDELVENSSNETTVETTEEIVQEEVKDDKTGFTRGKFKSVSTMEFDGYYRASFDAEAIPGLMPASNYGVSLTKDQMEKVKAGDIISCDLSVPGYPNPTTMSNIVLLPSDTELKLRESSEKK